MGVDEEEVSARPHELHTDEPIEYALVESAEETVRHTRAGDSSPNTDWVLKYESVTPELRRHQQDIFDKQDAEELRRKGNIYVVADGFLLATEAREGAREYGAFTPRTAAQRIIETYLESEEGNPKEALQEAVQNTHIYGVDFATAVVKGSEAYVANTGRSRVYLLRGDSMQVLTRDSQQASLERESPEKGLELLRGRVAEGLIQLQPGDTLLLCTDGLWSPQGMSDHIIAQRIRSSRSLPEAVHRLTTEALDAGGPDNITAQLVRFNGLSTAPKP